MKMAVLLSGLNYIDVNDTTIQSVSKSLDSRQYTRNIKKYIYEFFTEKGYTINTFICTNESPIVKDLLESYNPVRHSFIPNTEDRRISKTIEVLRLLVDYMKETNNAYDMVCLTRLDIYFLQPLVNIDYTKLNIISMTLPNKQSKTKLVDDNFYLFPLSILDDIYNIYRTYRNYHFQGSYIMGGPSIIAHCFKKPFEEKCQIHYIENEEPTLVAEFTSFKLRYFNELNLIINKNIFTEAVEYFSRTRTVKIVIHNDKNITFTKLANGIFSWFGYTLDTGRYTLSFDILSDTDILIPFIKLHNPVIFHDTGPIYANKLKTINLTITVRNKNTDVIFIFDNYDKSAVIQFKNISIEKITKPLDLNVVVRGHFRTFEKTHQSLRNALSNTKHKIFMHTWDTIDANTASWHGNMACGTNLLNKRQKDLLNTFDEGYVIQSQSWTEEERNAIVLSRPYKTFLYFWQSIYECLNRIKEESQYILFTRYDIQINADFSDVSCEENEIVIGYAHRYPNDVIPYGFTDIVFLIHYNDVYKLLTIPQKIIDLQTNMDPKYKIAEDPITDFFYSNWAKVTPKWLSNRDIKIIRPEASS
jgi:hypothetical protein